MLEGHVALVGDHRPELGLDGHRFKADFEELGVLKRERVLRLRLVELPEGGLHGAQALRPAPRASRRVNRRTTCREAAPRPRAARPTAAERATPASAARPR